jgi:hypothetical protein
MFAFTPVYGGRGQGSSVLCGCNDLASPKKDLTVLDLFRLAR